MICSMPMRSFIFTRVVLILLCRSAADETINREDVGNLEETTTFDIVETGSTRGKRKLVASSGYTFVVKRQLRNETTEWRCCVRGKKLVVLLL